MAAMKCCLGNPWCLTTVVTGLCDYIWWAQLLSQVLQLHLVSITGVTATFGELMTATVKCKLGNSRWLSPRTFGLCCYNEDDVFDDVSAWTTHGVDLATHGGCHRVPSDCAATMRMMFLTMCLLGPLMVLINGLHRFVCLYHGGSHRGCWFARLRFGGQMVVAMHGLLGNLKRRHLVVSTVITGFAATFGEQMMVTVNCQRLAQVLQLHLVSR